MRLIQPLEPLVLELEQEPRLVELLEAEMLVGEEGLGQLLVGQEPDWARVQARRQQEEEVLADPEDNHNHHNLGQEDKPEEPGLAVHKVGSLGLVEGRIRVRVEPQEGSLEPGQQLEVGGQSFEGPSRWEGAWTRHQPESLALLVPSCWPCLRIEDWAWS